MFLKRFYIYILFYLTFLCTTSAVFSEGSASYCTSGNRLFLANGSHIYVYVRSGDVVHIGTSSYESENDISVTYPDGMKKKFNVSPDSPGYIKNHKKEAAGPLSAEGYEPITITSDTDGYMDIVFYASDLMKKNTSCEADFIPCGESGTCRIAAWDVTVTDNDMNINPGRVFAKSFRLSDSNSRIHGLSFYALTDDGYIYSFNTGEMTGIDWEISASNRGVIHIPSNMMVYASAVKDSEYKRAFIPDIEFFGRFPELKQDETTDKSEKTVDRSRASQDQGGNHPDSDEAAKKKLTPFVPSFKYTRAGDIPYRVFLSYPDNTLLQALGLSDPKPAPEAAEFSFTPFAEGNGGQFFFTSTDGYGTYDIVISSDDASFEPVILGNRLQSHNTVEWDGKDRYGNIAAAGSFNAQLRLRSGEIHFALDDIEFLYDGVKARLENSSSAGMTTVYYDNRNIAVDGHTVGLNRFLCNDGSKNCESFDFTSKGKDGTVYLEGALNRLDGVDSYAFPAMKTDGMYSDGLLLDVFAYPEKLNTYEIKFDLLPETEAMEYTAEIPADDNSEWFYSVNKSMIPFAEKYERIDFISSDGSTIIETGIKPDPGTGFVAEFELSSEKGTQFLLHTGENCIRNCYDFKIDSGSKRGVFIFDTLGISTPIPPFTHQYISFMNNVFYGNNPMYYELIAKNDFTDADDITVFGSMDDSEAAEIDLYSLIFYKNERPSHIFFPCRSTIGEGKGLCDYDKEIFLHLMQVK